MVHFVGAGPGAADLITLRGQRLLAKADVVIYTGSLINKELLSYCKEGCSLHDSAYLNLDQVENLILEAEKNSLDTVRLHTGDTALYSSIGEQIRFLKEHGISFDITPGVSSMFGGAASIGAELTLPGVSQSVIITRIKGRTPVPKGEDMEALASHGSTMVIFLSADKAAEVQDALLKGAYNEDTKVYVVYKATWDEEKIIDCSLGELAFTMEKEKINRTALIYVGNVFSSSDFEYSKLYDKSFTTGYRTGTQSQESE